MVRISYALILLVLCAVTNSSIARDIEYYLSNPSQLKSQIRMCQEQDRQSSKCQELFSYQDQITKVLLTARANPQAFGQEVLKLQQDLSFAQQKYNSNDIDEQQKLELSSQIKDYCAKYQLYLGIIRWLESP